MSADHYIPGLKFGRMSIVARISKTEVFCACSCGSWKIVRGLSLKYGTTTSCGCVKSEQLAQRNKTHGQTEMRTYRIWCGMVTRCTNPNRREAKWYSAAGIKVCRRWLKFENFLADMGEAPSGLSLDRRKSYLGYSRTNCRWATKKEQIDNRSNSILLKYDGLLLSLSDWSARTGISYGTLKSRVHMKWPTERILTEQPRRAA